jgi:glycosyltransferase involved in cell wall biosynthesis
MRTSSPNPPPSPYLLDRTGTYRAKKIGSIFFDGVFKGDYSLAIVNRYLARALIGSGLDVTLHTPEQEWRSDRLLNGMSGLLPHFAGSYPLPNSFDLHIRNTWPPKADDMVGKRLNAYVCFAWEETAVPRQIVDQFNRHLDLIMVTSHFVKDSLLNSGITKPVEVVGNGVDHALEFSDLASLRMPSAGNRRILHVSSCFPRKGVDVLLDAFTRSFTKADNVTLTIKTFDNPHNTVSQDLARLRNSRPDAAEVDILKQHLSPRELAALVASSDLMVAPSRGEGFGLPLAEAMLLDVPVVTTAFSGQTDFCTAETAWLVDYTLAPSKAHVSADGSLWAEPDAKSLVAQIKHALVSKETSRTKLSKAKALLLEHFKWSDVARRVCHAIDRTLAADGSRMRSKRPEMKIDLVSTWNQACGIASYSQALFKTAALQSTLERVMAREIRGDGLPNADPAGALRPWGYEKAGIRRLAGLLEEGTSDVVWLQHHPSFFSEDDMSEIGLSLKRSSYRLKVLTMHNVRDAVAGNSASWLSCFDTVIVHTERDAGLLAERKISPTVIPHGILSRTAASPRRGAYFTVGTFGFLYPHKNVPLLVEALALARRIEPRLRLKLLNCVRKDPVSYRERARVEALVKALGLEDAVDMDFGFLSEDEILDRLAGCDLLCFPYGDSNESATGAARIALAAGPPLLCSQSGVLADLLQLSLVLPKVQKTALADALVTLSASPALCALRDIERKRYVERCSYAVVADQHSRLFASLLRGGQ